MQSSTFADLPIDIFEPISAFVDGWSLANLWLIGSQKLHSKLAHGVTTFNHKYGPRSPKKWPNVVSKFNRLQHLYIGVDTQNPIFNVPDIDLSTIPECIQSLHIRLPNAFLAFLHFSPSSDPDISFTHRITSKMFPLLTSLEISDYYDLMKMPNLQTSLGNGLPQNLTFLALEAVITASCVNHLPRSITNLEIKLNTCSEGAKEIQYPPNLRKLRIWPMRVKEAPIIPDSVTNLYIKLDTWGVSPLNLCWPTQLTSLTYISSVDLTPESRASLPSTLQHLRIKHIFAINDFKFLPRNLRSFSSNCQTGFFHLPTPQSLSDLPSSITDLTVPESVLAPEHWKTLPRTLTRLLCPGENSYHILAKPEIVPYIGDLPEMTQINISITDPLFFAIPANDENSDPVLLRPLLASLALPKGTKGVRIEIPSPSHSELVGNMLEKLPFLQDLHMSLGANEAPYVPRNLELSSGTSSGQTESEHQVVWTLEMIDCCKASLDRFMLVIKRKEHMLDLKTLNFGSKWAARLHTLAIYIAESWFQYSGLSGPQWIASLPRTLKKLDLQGYRVPFPTPSAGDVFKALPPGLKDFSAQLRPLILEDLRHLPMTIKNLDIPGSTSPTEKTAVNSVDELIQAIPSVNRRRLIHLVLPVSLPELPTKEVQKIIGYLPSIRHYALGRYCTPDDAHDHPPSLSSVVYAMRAYRSES